VVLHSPINTKGAPVAVILDIAGHDLTSDRMVKPAVRPRNCYRRDPCATPMRLARGSRVKAVFQIAGFLQGLNDRSAMLATTRTLPPSNGRHAAVASPDLGELSAPRERVAAAKGCPRPRSGGLARGPQQCYQRACPPAHVAG